MKLAAAGVILALFAAPAFADDDVAALIKKQSQQFSDASAAGDGKTLARLVDDDVVFMNESGEVATKADLAAATPAPAGSPHNKLVQIDFVIKVHGNVAVTSFTDESTVLIAGQAMHAKYRSTEVWMKKPAGWLMISSQTIAVNDDPPEVKLPAKLMDEYVGTYKAGDGFVFKIARAGDALTGSVNGAKPYPIKAELADVLFTPGQPRMRRIFQRDDKGKITGFVVRREGHDLVLKRVG